MTAKLAIPTFVGGPQDDLAAVDVYEQESDAVINSIQDDYLADTLSDDELLELVGGQAMDEAAAEALIAADDYVLSTVEIIDMTKDAVPEMVDGLKALTPVSLNGITSQVTSVVAGAKGQLAGLQGTIGGITGAIQGGIANAKGVMSMINGVAGQVMGTIKNAQGLVGGLSGIVKQACSMGIPNSFGALMSNVNVVSRLASHGTGLLNQVVNGALPSVVKFSDIGSLSSMANVCTPGAIISMQPSIIKDFSSSFNMPSGSPFSAVQGMFGQVTSTFNQINSTWNQVQRAGQQIASITNLQGASQAMNTVMRTGAMLSSNPVDKLQLLAQPFGSGSVMGSLSKSFPQTFLSGSATRVSGSVTSPIRTVVDLGTVYPTDYSPPVDDTIPPTEKDVLAAINNDRATGQDQYLEKPTTYEVAGQQAVATTTDAKGVIYSADGTKATYPDGTVVRAGNYRLDNGELISRSDNTTTTRTVVNGAVITQTTTWAGSTTAYNSATGESIQSKSIRFDPAPSDPSTSSYLYDAGAADSDVW